MESHDNETVEIECASQSARFVVDETIFVSIKGLHFFGCRGNTVTTVEELVVEDTIFQGVDGETVTEGRGTALVLDEVTFATITISSFISNTPGNNSQRHYVGEFFRDQDIPYWFRLQPDDPVSVGGALLTTSSNVLITDTKFVLNTAELGGVLLTYQSNITITQCTYSYNRAHTGGVMFTVESSVTTDNSMYSYNTAEVDGGVMDTYGGSFIIMSGTFTSNTAYGWGGVVHAYGGSFAVMNSTFKHNTAVWAS